MSQTATAPEAPTDYTSVEGITIPADTGDGLDFFDLLSKDPLASPAPAPATPAASAPVPGQPTATQPAPVPGQPAPVPGVPAPPPQPTAIEQTLLQQGQTLAALAAAQRQPAAPPVDARQALIQQYTHDVPDDVLNALGSDDPGQRRAGIQAIMTASGVRTHMVVQQLMGQAFQALEQRIMQTVQRTQATQTQQTDMQRDFYGRYPALNDPMIKPVVVQAAQLLLREQPHLAQAGGYTPQLGDAIAQFIAQRAPALAALINPQQPAPTPQPAAQRQGPPAQFGTTGARPPIDQQVESIADMLGIP